MICKNGTKHYLLLGIIYACIIFAADIIFEEHQLYVSILFGVVVGALIPVVLWLCDEYDVHCAKEIRELEMQSGQKIICEGWAMYDEHDGWLFFTEEYLKFQPYKKKDESFTVPYEKVTGADNSTAYLIISVEGQKKIKIHVNKPSLWKKTMNKAIQRRSSEK